MYKKGIYTVLSNEPLTPAVYRMVLEGDTQYITHSGQFINIELEGKFLRRPISVADYVRKNGLAIAVGTDSLSSNDDLDMVKELACLHEAFPEVPMSEMLEWACLNGARFLGKEDELGSFAPGKRPGIVLVKDIDQDGFVTAESRSSRII